MGSVDTDAGALTNAGATLGSQDVYPAAEMPRLPLTAAGVPGKTNVTVLQGKTQTIYPGSYGALTNNGTLRLAAGTYSFSCVTLGDKSITYALPFGNTVLSVAATLRTGTAATLAQVSGIAGAFDIVVMGADPSTSVAAASIGTSNSVVAVLTVPRGTISIGDNSAVTGALGARSIAAGNNVTLKYDSGLPAATVQVTCPDSVSSSMDPQTLSVSGDFGFGPTTLTDLFTLQTNGEVSTTMDTQRLGQELLRQTTSGRRADGTSETSIDYGSAFHGISHAEFIDNGTTISGTIDGRAFVPFLQARGRTPRLRSPMECLPRRSPSTPERSSRSRPSPPQSLRRRRFADRPAPSNSFHRALHLRSSQGTSCRRTPWARARAARRVAQGPMPPAKPRPSAVAPVSGLRWPRFPSSASLLEPRARPAARTAATRRNRAAMTTARLVAIAARRRAASAAAPTQTSASTSAWAIAAVRASIRASDRTSRAASIRIGPFACRPVSRA